MAIAWRIIDDDLSLQIVRDIMTICLSSSQDDDSMMIVSVERSIGHVWETLVHRVIQLPNLILTRRSMLNDIARLPAHPSANCQVRRYR